MIETPGGGLAIEMWQAEDGPQTSDLTLQDEVWEEIHRVLAPGGRYLGIERASPWLPPFSGRESRALEGRARERGIGERPVSLRGWRAILAEAGLEPRCVTPVPGRRFHRPWIRRVGNAVRPVHVAIRLTR